MTTAIYGDSLYNDTGTALYGDTVDPDGPGPDPDPNYATYGDPADTLTNPPPIDTDYINYGATGYVYGRPGYRAPDAYLVEPEDARAVVIDVRPARINHVRDPRFVRDLDVEEDCWRTDGLVESVTDLDHIYSSTGVEMTPGSLITYSSTTFTDYCIDARPTGYSGNYNYWKIAFFTTATDRIVGGFRVSDGAGNGRLVLGTQQPRKLPWDFGNELAETQYSYDPVSYSDDPADGVVYNETTWGGTRWELPPTSESGWYVYYDIVDLGLDAVFATPYVSLMSHATDNAFVTCVIAERFEDIDWITGPVVPPLGPGDVTDPFSRSAQQSVQRPVSADNALPRDPQMYFDGNSGVATPHPNYVWFGDEDRSASGFYPQKRARTDAIKAMMPSWLPVGRNLSVRFRAREYEKFLYLR